jgi:hypothetical protein
MRYAPFVVALVGLALLLWPTGAVAQWRSGDCGFYANHGSVGRQCASTAQAPPPQRVTAVCRDQTYSFDQGRATCTANGGVRVWLR